VSIRYFPTVGKWGFRRAPVEQQLAVGAELQHLADRGYRGDEVLWVYESVCSGRLRMAAECAGTAAQSTSASMRSLTFGASICARC